MMQTGVCVHSSLYKLTCVFTVHDANWPVCSQFMMQTTVCVLWFIMQTDLCVHGSLYKLTCVFTVHDANWPACLWFMTQTNLCADGLAGAVTWWWRCRPSYPPTPLLSPATRSSSRVMHTGESGRLLVFCRCLWCHLGLFHATALQPGGSGSLAADVTGVGSQEQLLVTSTARGFCGCTNSEVWQSCTVLPVQSRPGYKVFAACLVVSVIGSAKFWEQHKKTVLHVQWCNHRGGGGG